MAKHKRKAPVSKPVTQHQLFPAVVALWFGALFGLGSLAVRPTLIEELVIMSRIDLIVPAAAPPLGVTARMVLALGLAAMGAMIGAMIGREIARPKLEVRERKRTNLTTSNQAPARPYNDAAGSEPSVSAHPANRRRALAIEQEERAFVPFDHAPVPGGVPQILDIAAISADMSAPAAPFAPLPDGYVPPDDTAPAVPMSPVAIAPVLDWVNAAPIAQPEQSSMAAPATIEAQRQTFAEAAKPVADMPNADTAPGWTASPLAASVVPQPTLSMRSFETPSTAMAAATAAAEDGRQVFGMASQHDAKAEQPRQIFGAAVEGDHVPKEFVEAHGFRTSVFDVPEPSPLFAARVETATTPDDDNFRIEQPRQMVEEQTAPAIISSTDYEVVSAPEASASPRSAIAEVPATHLLQQPEPLPSPASLGMVDLAERLAESMRRRRAARNSISAVPAPVLQPAAALEHPPEALPSDPAEELAAPPFAMPAAFASAQLEQSLAAPRLAIPTAMRPLDLGDFEEAAVESIDSLLPPRMLATAQPEPEPNQELSPEPQPEEPVTAEAVELEAETIAEEDYGSLLEMNQAVARAGFVRIEEPELGDEAVEPVVIFPGQAPRAPAPFESAGSAVFGGNDSTPFRRFDSPSSAGQGQAVVTSEASPALAPEEADQALRAALANLQRMSGAA